MLTGCLFKQIQMHFGWLGKFLGVFLHEKLPSYVKCSWDLKRGRGLDSCASGLAYHRHGNPFQVE